MGVSERRLQIYVTADQYQELKARAKASGTSMAAVVREAVHRTLYEPDRERLRKGYEKIDRIVGLFQDGAGIAENHDEFLNDGRRWGKP